MRFVCDFADEASQPLRRVFLNPREVVSALQIEEVLPCLARIEAAANAGRYAAGFVSYEAAPAFDSAARVCAPAALPLLCFGLFDAPAAKHEAPPIGRFELSDWALAIDRQRYQDDIETIRAAIFRGDVYQVNYTLRTRARFHGDAFGYYEQLREAQRSAYCAFLEFDRYALLCASPELFFRWTHGLITARPMKGTARRGYVPYEDAELTRWLGESVKNRAENLMIVDLLRNDLSRLSVPGGVKVPELFAVEHYPTVHQMTSTITARTRPATRLADVFAALFPCGSITGAPKLKAMEIIAALERVPRGAYCGAIGIVEPGGSATFNVGIRSVTLDRATDSAECGLGGGITWDSTALEEFEEVLTKARFLRRRAADFELVETLLLDDGHYWLFERHLARLAHSAAHLSFTPPGEELRIRLGNHAADHVRGSHRVRLLYARDGGIRIETSALDRLPPGRPIVALARAPVPRSEETLYHKTTLRMVYEAHLAVAPPEVFDVLLWNEDGEVTEFTRGNVVAELDGQRFTPPVACGLLGGTFRQELLVRGEIVERTITRLELEHATRIWFVNSVRGWVGVDLRAV